MPLCPGFLYCQDQSNPSKDLYFVDYVFVEEIIVLHCIPHFSWGWASRLFKSTWQLNICTLSKTLQFASRELKLDYGIIPFYRPAVAGAHLVFQSIQRSCTTDLREKSEFSTTVESWLYDAQFSRLETGFEFPRRVIIRLILNCMDLYFWYSYCFPYEKQDYKSLQVVS